MPNNDPTKPPAQWAASNPSDNNLDYWCMRCVDSDKQVLAAPPRAVQVFEADNKIGKISSATYTPKKNAEENALSQLLSTISIAS